jgi:cytochrome P450
MLTFVRTKILYFYSKKSYFNFLDGHIIPKGANLIVGPYFMARDPNLWKDPLKFDPNRFGDDSEKIHPYAHVPFSAGPR